MPLLEQFKNGDPKTADTSVDASKNKSTSGLLQGSNPITFLTGGIGNEIQSNITTGNIRRDLYAPYLDEFRPEIGLDKMNRLRAENQSAGEKWLGFGTQLLAEVAGGTAMAIGSVSEIFDATITELQGGDADFNNWMIELGDNIVNASKEIAPIYQRDANKAFNVSDVGWWLNNGVSIASSLSMLVPGYGTSKAMSWIGKLGSQLAKGTKAGSKLNKALNATHTMSDKAKQWTKMASSAVTMRNAENMRESLGVLNDIKKDALKTFENEKEYQKALDSEIGKEYLAEGRNATKQDFANFIAAKSAWKTYAVNSANIVFDFMQARALLGTNYATRTGHNFSKGVQDAVKGKSKTQLQKVRRNVQLYARTAVDTLSEGVEEGINFIGEKYGHQEGKEDLGKTKKDKGFFDVVGDSLKDARLYESVFWGVAGGAAFQGAGKLVDITRGAEGKVDDSMKLTEIQGRHKMLEEFGKQLQIINNSTYANEELRKSDITKLKNSMVRNMGLNAAKSGNVDLLLEQINSGEFQKVILDNMTNTEIKNNGIVNMQETIANIKKQILATESDWNTAKNLISNREGSGIAKMIMMTDYVNLNHDLRTQIDTRDKMEIKVGSLLEQDTIYQQGIKDGKDLRNSIEITILEDKIKKLSKNLDKRSKIELEYYNKILQEKQFLLIGNKKESLKGVNIPVIKDYLISQFQHDVDSRISKGQISNILDYKKYSDTTNKIENHIKSIEQVKDDNKRKTYQKSVKDVINQEQDIDKVLSILNDELNKQSDNANKKWLNSQIGDYKAKLANKKKSAPIAKGKGLTAAEPINDSLNTNPYNKLLFDFGQDKGLETDNDEVNTVNKLLKDKDSVALEDVTKNSKNKILQDYSNKALNILKDEHRENVGNVYKDIQVGNIRSTKKTQITIRAIRKDGHDNIHITYEYLKKDGSKAISETTYDKLVKVSNEVKRDNDIPLKSKIASLDDRLITGEVISFRELINELGVVINPFSNQLFKAAYNIKVNIESDATQDNAFQLARKTDGTFALLINSSKVTDDMNTTEIMEHEAVHILLEAQILPVDKNALTFFKTFQEELQLPIDLQNTESELVYNIIKNSKHSEEFITYMSTNIDAAKLLLNPDNEILLDTINQLFSTPLYLPILNLLKGNLTNALNLPNSNVNKPKIEKVVAYTATKLAEELISDYGINPYDIIGTGKNGNIIKKDVLKYAKKNNLRPLSESINNIIEINPFETTNDFNIYIPFMDLMELKDGKIDVDSYNENGKYAYGKNFNFLTQEELENLVRTILDPNLNVNSSIEIKYNSNGTIGFYYQDKLIGYRNTELKLQNNVSFIETLLAINSLEELNTIRSSNKVQKDYINWRKSELNPNNKHRNEKLSDRLKLERSQLSNTIKLKQQLDLMYDKDIHARMFYPVSRKSSGNFNINNELTPLKDEFLDVTEIWAKGTSSTENVIYDSNGNSFDKKAEKNYYDIDYNYTIGNLYALLPGANSEIGNTNTYVPTTVKMAKANDKIANEVTDLLFEYVDTINKLKFNGLEFEYNKKDAEYYTNSKEGAVVVKTSSGKTLKQIEDNVGMFFNTAQSKGDKQQKNSIEFKRNNIHIKYSFTNKNGVEVFQTADIQYFASLSKQATFQIKKQDGNYNTLNKEIIPLKSTKKDSKVTGYNFVNHRNAISNAIKNILKNKQVQINIHKRNNSEFRDKKTYTEWMIKEGLVLTSVRATRNSKGKIMKNSRGFPLPSLNSKRTNKKSSNLILAIDMNQMSIESNKSINIKQEAITNKQQKEKTNENKEESVILTNTKGLNKDDKAILLSLLQNKEAKFTDVVEDDVWALVDRLSNNLEENDVLDWIDNEDGSYTITLIKDTSGLSSEVNINNTENNQGTLFKQIQEGDNKKEVIDEDKVKKWWKTTFGNNIELDTNIVGIIKRGSTEAWGVFEDAMVKLSKSSPMGTEYHEAYHVIHNLYLSENERSIIMEEAKDKYGNLSQIALEESLADAFMDYMLKNGETIKIDNQTKSFFDKIWNWIKTFFSKYNNNKSKIDKLFKNIRSSKFKNISPRISKYQKSITRYKLIDGLTRGEETEVINLIAKKFIEIYPKYEGISMKEIMYNNNNQLKEDIRLSFIKDSQNKLLSLEYRKNIKRIANNKTFNQLFNKSAALIKRQFNIDINKELTDVDDTVDKSWDDNAAFKISGKNNVTSTVKRLIMTIPSKDNGSFTGLQTYLNFNKVYPYLQRIMVNATNMNEMLARLKAASEFDSTMSNIAEQLRGDKQLSAAWFSNFNKQVPVRDYILIESDKIKVDSANKAASHYVLSNVWINEIKLRMENGYYTDNIKAEINKLKNQASVAVNKGNLKESMDKLSQVYNHLGIEISVSNLLKVINMPTLRRNGNNSIKDVFTNVLLSPVKATEFSLKNAKKGVEAKFEDNGNFNQLAAIASLFQYDLMENSSFDVNGNNVFSVQNVNFLSKFMEKFYALKSDNYLQQDIQGAKENLVKTLKEYGASSDMQFSNWLWDTEYNQGMLKLVNGKTDITKINSDSLNLDFIDNFGYSLLDGIKNSSEVEGTQYNNMTDNDWEFTQLAMFFGGKKSGDSNIKTIKTAIPIPSDGGNINFIETPYFSTDELGKVSLQSPIFKALYKAAIQDYYRAVDARDLMFDVNTDGIISVKENLDLTTLQRGYHYGKNNIDNEGNPILIKNGKPTGNVFEAFFIPEITGIGYYENSGVPMIDVNNSKLRRDYAIENIVLEFAKNQVKSSIERFDKHRQAVEQIETYRINYGTSDKAWNKFITEFSLNYMINTNEQFNFFIGNRPEYKNSKDTNKRAKEIVSPGITLSEYSKTTFKSITMKDRELDSRIFDNIASKISEALVNEQSRFKNVKFNSNNLRKHHNDKNVKLNDLEKNVYNIVSGYLNVNTGDAQGYITINRYEDIMRGLGRLDNKMQKIINKSRNGIILQSNELDMIMNPLKGFYYGRDLDIQLSKMVSTQIKYSTVPLIPQLVKGTQMENLYNFMNKNNIDEAFFESAHKVGMKTPLIITDKNGNITKEALSKYSDSKYHGIHKNSNWRLQLDNPDHLVDADNKLGTQIAKIILSNIHPDTIYEIDGKKYKGRNLNNNDNDLVQHYMNIMSMNIQESANELLTRLSVTKEYNENGIPYYKINNYQKLHEILIEEVESRGLSENYIENLKLVDGKFNMPLFMNIMANKWESIISSLFTNNIINQKQSGGSAVMMSTAFLNKDRIAEIEDSFEGLELRNSSDFENNDGIEWISSKKDNNDKELKFEIVDGIIYAEGLLPRTSKNFFIKDENGNEIPLTIDEINKSNPKLLEQIWYRIPYEKKGSSIVVKIVGFLPSNIGNTLVLPLEAINMSGEDFDNDKRFGMYLESYKKDNKLHTWEYYSKPNDKGFEQWLHYEGHNKPEDKERKDLRLVYDNSSLTKQNPKPARNNRIHSIMKAILQNPTHLKENLSPSSFKDGVNVIKEQEEITDSKSNPNPFTIEGQLFFRKQNIDGRALKGMAADSNAFLPVAQVSRMEMRNDLGYVGKYSKENNYNLKELRRKYGDNNVTEDKNNFYVKHTRLGWNLDNTYTNIKGDVTTNHSSQILAQILDIVKEGIPPNVNTYTFYTYVTMMNMGVTMRHASLYINQPILQDIVSNYFAGQSILEKTSDRAISQTKSKYQAELLLIRAKLNKIDSTKNSKLLKAAQKGNMFLKAELVKPILGYNSNINYNKDLTNGVFNNNELKNMIDYNYNNQDTWSNTNDKGKLEKRAKFLTNQLLISERYLKYKEMGEAFSDIIRAMSSDRKSVGPSIAKTRQIEKAQKHAELYPSTVRQSSIPKFQSNSELFNIESNIEITNVTFKGKSKDSKLKDDKKFIRINEGARVLVNVNGNKIPAVRAVFPNEKDNHKSVYPAIRDYYKFGNKLGYDVISPMFIRYSPAFKYYADSIIESLGMTFNENTYKKITEFAKIGLLSKLSYLDLDKGQKDRILGVEKLEIDLSLNLDIETFKTLSTAQKLRYIKNRDKEQLNNDTHILNYLNPKLDNRSVRVLGYHGIDFINTMTDNISDDYLIDSFSEMWDSTDKYIKLLVEDMIKYTYLTNGFTMKKNSFAKLIPTKIFEDIGMNNFMYEQLKSSQDPNYLNKIFDKINFTDLLIRNNSTNSRFVPYLNLDKDKKRRSVNIYNNSIIKITENSINDFGVKAYSSEYLNIPIMRQKRDNSWIKVNTQLYKLVDFNHNVRTYIPVSRLGSNQLFEYTNESILSGNNPQISQKALLDIVNGKHQKHFIVHKTGLPIHKIMFEKATAVVGKDLFGTKGYVSDYQIQAKDQDMKKIEFNNSDKIMVVANTASKGNSFTKTVFTDSTGKRIKKDSPYYNLYHILNDGGTLMLVSPFDNNGNKFKRNNYDSAYHIGNTWLIHHFNMLSKETDVNGNPKMYIEYIDGIAYISKEKNCKL